jgi:hypothetical protein
MSNRERVQRLGKNMIQRALMPPSVASLRILRRTARMVGGDEKLSANFHAGALVPGQIHTDTDEPFVPSIKISPDVTERLGIPVHDLPLYFRRLMYDPYAAARKSEHGTALPSWEVYLPDLAEQGIIGTLGVSLNRGGELPDATGTEAMKETHFLGQELTRDTANPSRLGALPEQISNIYHNLDGLFATAA